MAKKEKDVSCVPTGMGCCKVEAVISVDERGQMVLPKEMREKANIRAGDKLAVTSWEKDGKVCCISLIKAEDLTDMVRSMLGPVMGEILQK
jgi:antitoxin PrlF